MSQLLSWAAKGPSDRMTHGVHYRNVRLGGVVGHNRYNGRIGSGVRGFVSFRASLFLGAMTIRPGFMVRLHGRFLV